MYRPKKECIPHYRGVNLYLSAGRRNALRDVTPCTDYIVVHAKNPEDNKWVAIFASLDHWKKFTSILSGYISFYGVAAKAKYLWLATLTEGLTDIQEPRQVTLSDIVPYKPQIGRKLNYSGPNALCDNCRKAVGGQMRWKFIDDTMATLYVQWLAHRIEGEKIDKSFSESFDFGHINGATGIELTKEDMRSVLDHFENTGEILDFRKPAPKP